MFYIKKCRSETYICYSRVQIYDHCLISQQTIYAATIYIYIETLCFYKNLIYIIMIMFSPVCDIPYHLEARLWETLYSGHNGIPRSLVLMVVWQNLISSGRKTTASLVKSLRIPHCQQNAKASVALRCAWAWDSQMK